MTNNKRPSSLIKQERVLPNEQPAVKRSGLIQSAKNTTDNNTVSPVEVPKDNKSRKFKNQDATIKLSRPTKEEIELLMKLKDTKFVYEMIETMIDSYVVNELTNDEQRSFRTLKEFIQK